MPSDLSPTINFVFKDTLEIWGADDDTDIEYMYQHLFIQVTPTFYLRNKYVMDG